MSAGWKTGTGLECIKATMHLLRRDAEGIQLLPNQAESSVAIKWGCSAADQLCRLLQCLTHPWLGCCVCTISFISQSVWAVVLLCWSTAGAWQVEFYFAQQSEARFSRCRASFYKRNPMDPNVYTILCGEVSFLRPYNLCTHSLYKNVQESP